MTTEMHASAAVPRPIPDRPLTVMDVLDGAFNVIRARPRTVTLIIAVFVLPTYLLTAWLQRDIFASFDLSQFDTETGQFANQESLDSLNTNAALGPTTFLTLLALPYVGVALTHLLQGWFEGVDRSAKDCLLFAGRKSGPIIGSFIIGKLFQLVTCGLALPFTLMIAPVIAAEGLGPWAAVKRASSLAWKQAGYVIGVTFAIVIVSQLLGNAFTLVPMGVAFVLGRWGWVGFFAVGTVTQIVLTAFSVGTAVLAYFSVINRTDGADIRRRLHQL